MMRWLGLVSAVLAAGGPEPVRLRPGAYEVEVRLDLPHLDEAGARKIVRLCLAGLPAQGFPVLSDNTPFAHCPATGLRQEGEAVHFAIQCEGRNAGQGSAIYRLAPEGFEGRIALRLGGKNMTLTELQTGRWRGECAPGDRPLP
ncbi:DUF3617 domain-containing protein [Methylobacterium nodulans]|uniref:DUF3617 family protein n=1 Tax=Methylobacterium nodulans (strain LMG 21967 / CNCM I-2342 / ORS 2060) TaxID=460265 RepID=B8ICF4_METNO|nr:DUF3617 family protein [Methylobacterium nodulans]ACL55542.1 conserved hypothetical protein [Methylobacterium nodulans ORS 2060]